MIPQGNTGITNMLPLKISGDPKGGDVSVWSLVAKVRRNVRRAKHSQNALNGYTYKGGGGGGGGEENVPEMPHLS